MAPIVFNVYNSNCFHIKQTAINNTKLKMLIKTNNRVGLKVNTNLLNNKNITL